MSVYRLRLQFVSPPGTRPAADTLFGHICWGLVYEQGPDVLGEFLKFMDGPDPPLVITGPMPADHWPMPPLPAPSPKAYEQLIDETQLNGPWSGCDRCAAVDRLGVLSEAGWIPSDIFASALSDLSMETLLQALGRIDIWLAFFAVNVYLAVTAVRAFRFVVAGARLPFSTLRPLSVNGGAMTCQTMK